MSGKQSTLISLVDWLQFTLFTNDLNMAYEILGISESEFIEMEKGLYSYKKRKACGNIWVMYDGNKDMGIHIQLNGQGCREFETFYNGDWFKLFKSIFISGSTVSRLDLAIDDIRYNGEKPYWTLRQLIRKAKRGEVRTKWKKGMRQEQFDFKDGKSLGDTLYCGSTSSLIRCVFYEKDKERIAQGKEIEEGLTTWNRLELRLSDDRAMTAVEWIVQGFSIGELLFGILKHYINFLIRDKTDSNKSRWEIEKWWLEFLNNAEKLSLAKKAPDKTIETKINWVDKQVLPTLAEIWVALDRPGQDYFVDMINEGLERMTDQQWQRAEEYREKLLLQMISDKERQKQRKEKYMEERNRQIEEYRQKNYRPMCNL